MMDWVSEKLGFLGPEINTRIGFEKSSRKRAYVIIFLSNFDEFSTSSSAVLHIEKSSKIWKKLKKSLAELELLQHISQSHFQNLTFENPIHPYLISSTTKVLKLGK